MDRKINIKEFTRYYRNVQEEIVFEMRLVRERKGFTQQDMADLIGVSRGHISDLEGNKCDLSFRIMAWYSKILDVPIISFFRVALYKERCVTDDDFIKEFNELTKDEQAYVYGLMHEINEYRSIMEKNMLWNGYKPKD